MAAASSAAAPPPHALLLPYPAQGHVIPLMELAHRLLDSGFAVTFVNTEFNHRRVVAAAADGMGSPTPAGARLRLVPVVDGIADGGDHENLIMLNDAMREAIPPQVEALLDAGGDGEGLGKVTCVVVDVGMSWVLDAVRQRGLPAAAFWPASAAVLAVLLGAKKLIRDGVIDDDGAHLNLQNKSFQLTESMAPMDETFLAWNFMGNGYAERLVFHYLTATANEAADKADLLVCNTFADLEPAIFRPAEPAPATSPATAAAILPAGPLRAWQRPTRQAPVGHFWRPAADEACLAFLDGQPRRSVVYVAFGSIAVMSPAQLREVALGLEASGRPFLWVVRPGLAGELPAGLASGEGGKGKGMVVEWAPQERVLAHPALGCFVTHCGWNSTLEGVRNGVPLLCWPYFSDQFTNQTYICDVWRVGLRVSPAGGGGGTVTKERIVERLEAVMGDTGVMDRAQKLKEAAERSMSEEGESMKHLNTLIEFMRRQGERCFAASI